MPHGDASGGRHVTVRMYNVGFGDAFLVTVPDGGATRRILFDCGSLEAAKSVTMKSIVDRIVKDATDDDGVARIDVVVATHRHKDHVSGFEQKAWSRVTVREVWMPWTEDPTDDKAREIRDIQSRLALALNAWLTAGSTTAAGEQQREEDLRRGQDLISNALMLSNEKAMETLHGGFAGSPRLRFLPAKTGAERTFEPDVVPGVKVHVMGPSRSKDIIRDMEPPQGKSYLRLRGAADGPGSAFPSPFAPEFRRDSDIVELTEEERRQIEEAWTPSELAVAVALDKAVNGTSLMLALEVTGTVLLFPGDAQWGTWNEAMNDPEWKEILARVSFYKVGHHGSHNATPKEFVETMIPGGIRAMASTLTRRDWQEIPKEELLRGLVDKGASVARSDQPDQVPAPFKVDGDVIEVSIPF